MKERPTQRVDAAQARVQKSILFIPKPHLPFSLPIFKALLRWTLYFNGSPSHPVLVPLTAQVVKQPMLVPLSF